MANTDDKEMANTDDKEMANTDVLSGIVLLTSASYSLRQVCQAEWNIHCKQSCVSTYTVFLAAMSSSRSLVVGLLVGLSVSLY